MKPQETYLESKYKDKLLYSDQPPGEHEYFEHDFGSYKLEGRILYNQAGDEPWVLSIHGARADLSKSDAASFGLQARGVSLINFTMSGHSQANPVSLQDTSLAKNIDEAGAFFSYLSQNRPATIIGYSLGSNVALELLRRHGSKINHLVLFSPAVYAREAYAKHYGEPFKSVIGRPFSYRENDILRELDKFQGDLLVIKGEHDGLEPQIPGTCAGMVHKYGRELYSPIPKEVFDLIMSAGMPANRKEQIEIPGSDHAVLTYLRQNHPEKLTELLDKIADFVKN